MERLSCAGCLALTLWAAQATGLAQPLLLEHARIPAPIKANRELRLWMESPKKEDRGPLTPDNVYTCPEDTLGSFYSGPARLSLVDTSTGKTLHTIAIRDPETGADTFRIPYRIIAGRYYAVPGVSKELEGKPRILALQDINGDGMALEFPLFVKQACMGLETALLGYSVKQDRAIQYAVDLEVTGVVAGKKEQRTWVDMLFSLQPDKPGVWTYSIDYRGRGGSLYDYRVVYNRSAESFSGTVRVEQLPLPGGRSKE